MATESFLSSRGAVWAQVAPNRQPQYLGCMDADTINEPGNLIDTLIRCFTEDGSTWRTITSTKTALDPVTTSLTTFIGGVANFLETQTEPVSLLFHQSDTGRRDIFANWQRSVILEGARIGDKSQSNLVMREEDVAAEQAFSITAQPPAIRVWERKVSRLSTSSPEALNSILFCDAPKYGSVPGAAKDICSTGFAAGDALSGSPSDVAQVLYTADKGATWTATATNPFAAAENIMGLACFPITATANRVVVGRGTTDAANPPEVAYSDDNGATWTLANLGSTNALFIQRGEGLFAYDQYNMWAVTDGGYIFYSNDGGVTWSVQDAGVVTSNTLNCVHFSTSEVGYIGGAADTILKTEDGGDSWTAVAATGNGGDILTVFVKDENTVWVGTDDGELFYTEDGGTTWTERSFTGTGVGDVRSVRFAGDQIGFLLTDNASPVGAVHQTIDGGYSWQAISTPTNAGLNNLAICSNNSAYAVGEVQGGTGVILKLYTA